MKKISLIVILFSSVLMMSSCKKEKAVTPQPTTLELNLKDEFGNPVSGASVKLYSSITDWNNETNQIGSTLTSDANGKVTFNNLSNISYYYLAEKDCENNVNGSNTTSTPLTANVNNVATVILTSTGDIEITNSSTDNYRIYVNGAETLDITPGSTETLYYNPVGAYTVRTLQLDGFILTPTDLTYNGDVVCGSTFTVNIP